MVKAKENNGFSSNNKVKIETFIQNIIKGGIPDNNTHTAPKNALCLIKDKSIFITLTLSVRANKRMLYAPQ